MKPVIKVKTPFYYPVIGCYEVIYSIDGMRTYQLFDSREEGLEFIKRFFPEWFKKHYKQAV